MLWAALILLAAVTSIVHYYLVFLLLTLISVYVLGFLFSIFNEGVI